MFYKFENKIPIATSTINVNNIDENGNGWLECDWGDKLKPELRFIDNNWNVIDTANYEDRLKYSLNQQRLLFKKWKQKLRNDGEDYYQETDLKITIQFFGRPSDEIIPMVTEVDSIIMPIMNLINDGQWYSALIKINQSDEPLILEVLELFQNIKLFITDYVNNNYNHK